MIRFKPQLILLLLLLGLAGCRKEDPNPELLDPIYADLERRATEMQKNLDEEVKKQEDLHKTLEKSEPNTIELKNAQRDLARSDSMVVEYGQQTRYLQIRAKRRLLVDRITYKAAFAKNKSWPDPREYSDYLVNMRLQEAPRNWSIRVPKLQDRLSKRAPAAEKAKEKTE